jgi:hypothetical protein
MTVPPYYAPPPAYMPLKSKRPAVAALATGVAALVFSWVPVLGLILGVAAGVLGVLGIKRSARTMSVVGLSLGGLSVLINVVVLAAVASASNTSPTGRQVAIAGTSDPSTQAPETTEPTTEAPETTEPTTEAPERTEPTAEAPETTEPTIEAPETTEPPAPTYRTPKPSDFRLTVKNTSKHCFGSAGCNIRYRVKVALKNGVSFDPDMTYDVTFDVLGGEDGPVTGTFSLEEGDTYSGYDLEGFLSTSSSGRKLTAKVTDIEEG